jgi:hypothetical protein
MVYSSIVKKDKLVGVEAKKRVKLRPFTQSVFESTRALPSKLSTK